MSTIPRIEDDQQPSWETVVFQSGRIDHFLRDAFKEIVKEVSAPPAELKRLVKISASLPRGQAFVESGFSTTKYVVTDRNSIRADSIPKITQGW